MWEKGEFGLDLIEESDKNCQTPKLVRDTNWTVETRRIRVQLLTIHLSLFGKNYFSAAAWWIDGESFLKALFDVGTPDSLRIRRRQIFFILRREIRLSKLTSVSCHSKLTSLTSLMSPTSRCFASMPDPFVSAGPSVGPAPTGGHLDVIVVPDPSPPSAIKQHKKIN